MQGTLVNLCYTMENHAIATMMTYFGSTDHGLGTEVDRGCGGMSSKNRLESPLIYIHLYLHTHTHTHTHIYITSEDIVKYKKHMLKKNWTNNIYVHIL